MTDTSGSHVMALPRGSFAWEEDGVVYQLTRYDSYISGNGVAVFNGIWHEDGLSGKAYFGLGSIPVGEARDLALALIPAAVRSRTP